MVNHVDKVITERRDLEPGSMITQVDAYREVGGNAQPCPAALESDGWH